jgi:septal ring factor EnvC (AmiA/AmiB activator)
LKKARDRLEENLQKTENELYDLKKVTSKLNKQNHVLERRLRNNQTQMKELLLCD